MTKAEATKFDPKRRFWRISPTGIQEINRFDGVRLETRIWDAVEARVHARHREPPA